MKKKRTTKATMNITPARKAAQIRNWNKRTVSCYTSGIMEMLRNRADGLTDEEKQQLIKMLSLGQTILTGWKSTIKE